MLNHILIWRLVKLESKSLGHNKTIILQLSGCVGRHCVLGFQSKLDRVEVSRWMQHVLPYQTMLEKQVRT